MHYHVWIEDSAYESYGSYKMIVAKFFKQFLKMDEDFHF